MHVFNLQPPERQIVVGICAMSKKSKSKPMKEILERLCLFKYITVVTLEEEVILNEPVENWPLCDCLISFHSKGLCHHVWFCLVLYFPLNNSLLTTTKTSVSHFIIAFRNYVIYWLIKQNFYKHFKHYKHIYFFPLFLQQIL